MEETHMTHDPSLSATQGHELAQGNAAPQGHSAAAVQSAAPGQSPTPLPLAGPLLKLKPMPPTRPWWRYGFVWLVISGPAVVVVAALATAWIAVTHPDPVTDEDYYRHGLEINKTLGEDGKAMMPALQGRNHAATPPGP
jgi:hypothetical protein